MSRSLLSQRLSQAQHDHDTTLTRLTTKHQQEIEELQHTNTTLRSCKPITLRS